MTWADIYLLCFLVGFALSALAFLAGTAHLHLPHIHFHFHGPMHGTAGGHGAEAGHGGEASYFNFGTITGFLAWFGGTGYILARDSALGFFVALGVSILSGLGGATIIFLFLAKFMMPHEKFMDPADYEMIGVLGTVTSRVRTAGTGEMIFLRDGGRRVAYIRSDTGEEIGKGTEVVITRFEKGIAYVRRWEDLCSGADTRS
jgi:membrane protein implicated in regulation of membrane protease activity